MSRHDLGQSGPITNIGAGHSLPTTPTPAAWLSITLLDARGQPLTGATASAATSGSTARGTSAPTPAYLPAPPPPSGARGPSAHAARITVEVHPDDDYERLYADQLTGRLTATQRALYQQALTRALANRYVAEQRDIALAVANPVR